MLKLITSVGLVLVTLTLSQFAVAQPFIDISKGGNQICAVTTDSDLVCSTSSAAERLLPPAGTPKLSQVEVGDSHACGLTLDGGIVCWGDNNFNQLDAPSGVGFISIDAGWNHTCATSTDLTSVCWGLSDNGRLDVPSDGLPFVQLDAGLVSTCGLEAAGGIRCWGVSEFRWDPPSANAGIQSFASTSTNGTPFVCALLENGAIECDYVLLEFSGTYTDIAAVGGQICALDVGGGVQCDSSTSIDDLDPTGLDNGAGVASLFSGIGMCAIDVVGEISCLDAIRTPGAGFPPASNFISLPNAGIEAPGAVDDLTASIYSDNTVELFWTSSRIGGAGRVVGADIYRDGALLARTNQSSSYIDNTLMPGVEYTYEVRVVNSRDDVGPAGNTISVNTADRNVGAGSNYVRPNRLSDPFNLTVLAYSDTVVELFWDRSSNRIFGFEIYRDHEYIGFTNGLSYFDDTLIPGVSYHYDLLAVRQDGEILGFAGITSLPLTD